MNTDDQHPKNSRTASESILVDHKLLQNSNANKLWPAALGLLLLVATLAGGFAIVREEKRMKGEILSLSAQLIASRKKVEQLIIDNALLNKRLLQANANPTNLPSDRQSPIAQTEADPQIIKSNLIAKPDDNEPELLSAVRSDSTGKTSLTPASWTIIVGAFSSKTNASLLVNSLKQDGFETIVKPILRKSGELLQVRAVNFPSSEEAARAARAIEKQYSTGRLAIFEEKPEGNTEDISAKVGLYSSEGGVNSQSNEDGSPKPTFHAAPDNDAASGWLILIDVYSDSTTAKETAEGLKNDGYNAKIAVEFSQGEISYRVHIVGIKNRESGEKLVGALSTKNQYPILQLKQHL